MARYDANHPFQAIRVALPAAWLTYTAMLVRDHACNEEDAAYYMTKMALSEYSPAEAKLRCGMACDMGLERHQVDFVLRNDDFPFWHSEKFLRKLHRLRKKRVRRHQIEA